jgi:hypothetical protein
MKDLSGTKLVQTCVKKALGMDLLSTPPAASSSELTEGVTLLACSGRGLVKRKIIVENYGLNMLLAGTDASRQMAYGYLGCGARDILETFW